MNQEIKKRLLWVKLFEEARKAGIVCRRCGISRPTLRKWVQRYRKSGLEGLTNQNRRPLRSPQKKIFSQQEQWILDFRKHMNWGTPCIQNELRRIYGFNLSLASIHEILTKMELNPLFDCGGDIIRDDIIGPFREIESKWIPLKLLLAVINTRPSMTVRGSKSWLYSRDGMQKILWNFLKKLLKRCLSPFSGYKLIGEENSLHKKFRTGCSNIKLNLAP